MADLKRLPVKYIRDRAKSAYEKDDHCFICGEESNLDFHHFYSVDQLFTKWCKQNSINIRNVEDILAHRDTFIEEHHQELYEDAITLCNSHHKKLHKIYGQKPTLPTGPKQKRWVQKQQDKFLT
jgi:hypothetical protein